MGLNISLYGADKVELWMGKTFLSRLFPQPVHVRWRTMAKGSADRAFSSRTSNTFDFFHVLVCTFPMQDGLPPISSKLPHKNSHPSGPVPRHRLRKRSSCQLNHSSGTSSRGLTHDDEVPYELHILLLHPFTYLPLEPPH